MGLMRAPASPKRGGKIRMSRKGSGAASAGASGSSGSRGPPDPNSAAGFLIKKLRACLEKRGTRGMVGISRNFRIMDSSGDGQLDEEEFGILLDRVGVKLNRNEKMTLFEYFDSGGDGTVDQTEFLTGIRDPMSERRQKFVCSPGA